MEEWMNNPAIKNLDPAKLELIKMAAARTKGKSGRELAPIMLALISGANKQGIRFSPDEVTLILEILKQGKSNQTYRVEAIHTSLDLERRLEALGLTDGSLITVINNEKKGAMTARFRGARFALGRQIAEQITVSEVNPHE